MRDHHPEGPRPNTAVPVARMDRADPMDAWCVAALRHWCDGPEGQTALWSTLARRVGPPVARGHLDALARLIDLLLEASPRTLTRRPLHCAWIGADEAVFATLIRSWARGKRETAHLIALELVRAGRVPAVLDAAQDLGLRLARLGVEDTPAGRPAVERALASAAWPDALPMGPGAPPGTLLN